MVMWLLLLTLASYAEAQCNGCTMSIVADDTYLAPGSTYPLTSFSFASQYASIVSFTGYDSQGRVGIYYKDGSSPLDYFVDQRNSRIDGQAYVGLIRGLPARSSTASMTSYIGRTASQTGVYIASVSGSTKTTITIANKNTPIPGSSLKFTDFADSSMAPDGTVVFLANYDGGQGIYLSKVDGSSRTLTKIVDYSTTIPGTSYKFTYLASPRIGGNIVTYFGSFYNSADPPAKAALCYYDLTKGQNVKAVSYTDSIPGRSQSFTSFSSPGIDANGQYIVAIAQGTVDFWGCIKYTISSGKIEVVADDTTTAPVVNKKFTGFQGAPSVNTNGVVAFRIVHEPDPLTGIYTGKPNGSGFTLDRVVGVTSVLSGIGTVEKIGFGDAGFFGNQVVFPGTVKSGTKVKAGVWLASIPSLADGFVDNSSNNTNAAIY